MKITRSLCFHYLLLLPVFHVLCLYSPSIFKIHGMHSREMIFCLLCLLLLSTLFFCVFYALTARPSKDENAWKKTSRQLFILKICNTLYPAAWILLFLFEMNCMDNAFGGVVLYFTLIPIIFSYLPYYIFLNIASTFVCAKLLHNPYVKHDLDTPFALLELIPILDIVASIYLHRTLKRSATAKPETDCDTDAEASIDQA